MKRLLIISILINLVACDFFSTRSPEDPETGRSNFSTPDSPDIVLSNLQSSFTNKNIVNFLRCFQDANFESVLEFTPSQSALVNNAFFFDNWELKNEEIIMNNLFNSLDPNAIPFLSFINIEQQQNPLKSIVQADYYILVNHGKDFEKEYTGTVQFNIISETNDYWYISKWIDFNSSSSTITESWSNLKFNFGR
ncbi:hypothetical protein OAQ99_02465 [Candidatus Kapabacteria bacterium]|nr:hypothetical protein [Candidatus Kapabacteria bacterium]